MKSANGLLRLPLFAAAWMFPMVGHAGEFEVTLDGREKTLHGLKTGCVLFYFIVKYLTTGGFGPLRFPQLWICRRFIPEKHVVHRHILHFAGVPS